MLWSTVLKAAKISSNARADRFPTAMVIRISHITFNTADTEPGRQITRTMEVVDPDLIRVGLTEQLK